jgi:predicted ATPase/DNA-binding SARP family transcriptional activator
MRPKLELSLLGTVTIRRNGAEISEPIPAKSQALLFYLAVTGRPHSREKLAGLLWGEKSEVKAKANLRKALSILRRLCEDALIITRPTVSFDHNSDYWLDVAVLESALAANELAPEKLEPLREAAELYRGEFLEGFSVRQATGFEEWVLGERERLRQLAIQGLQRLSEAYATQGKYAAGIECANRLLALEPWQEEAHRQLMTLLARSGQQSAALAQYETCRRVLAEELGVEPLAETQALYHRLKTRREAAPHNLPPQTTPFVGRQAELTQISRHLNQADCRLLTLVGAGGMGKTRLALQAAGQALDAFDHGVYFVPLARISGPEFLVPTIREALGYSLSGQADPKKQLLNYLQQKEILLVLDNFEHLLSAPGGNNGGRNLALEMINAAPRLKLLVTSRERLNLQAEWLLTLQGLPYPPEETDIGEKTAVKPTKFEAVQLFVQGVRRVRPDFALSAEWTEVARICRLLEGMPLGIELAATWASMMPCAEIARELARSLGLLSTTLHDVPTRHRSLEAVFDHSWQILSEVERDVFKKLSLFRGGFDRQAAKEVAGASLSTLAGLVNKSLLRVVAPGRYDMLEPLKQYAAAKLAETPTENERQNQHDGTDAVLPQARQRHARYYLSFAEQIEQDVKGPGQLAWLEQMEAECGNLRAALAWAFEPPGDAARIPLGASILRSIQKFWPPKGLFQEGLAWVEKALAHQEKIPDLETLAVLFYLAGYYAHYQGMFSQAEAYTEKGLRLAREIDDHQTICNGLQYLAMVVGRQGDYQRAADLLREVVDMERAHNPDRITHNLTVALNNLGLVLKNLGDYDQAAALLEEKLTHNRAQGNRLGLAAGLTNLGDLAILQENYPQAHTYYQEALEIRREMGDASGTIKSLTGMVTLSVAQGQFVRGAQLYAANMRLRRQMNFPAPPQLQRQLDINLACIREALEPDDFEAARATGGAMTLEEATAYALE